MRHELTLTPSDGSEPLILSVPTSWHDVTLQQYIDWQCSTEPAICCLAGITKAQLEQLPWEEAGYLLNLLAFAAELPDAPVSPDLVAVGDATYGQMIAVQQYLEANPDQPEIWYAPFLYALYRSRQLYGSYDPARIEAMRAAILQEPVGQVFGDLTFTWAVWLLSTSATPPTPKRLWSPTTTKKKPAWKSWWSVLASCLPSTRWRPHSASPAGSS
jgi:hypothetical protein